MSDYYTTHFEEFVNTTLDVDLSDIYESFTSLLPKSATILDVGCGPGRDLKYFLSRGFNPVGIDPNEKFVFFATKYSGCEVKMCSIEDYQTTSKYDGIWACASLLHLPTKSLVQSLHKISTFMHPNSVFYCSFKLGTFEGERNGRYFNDQTPESLFKLLPKELQLQREWITKDKRPDRSEKWLNLLLSLS